MVACQVEAGSCAQVTTTGIRPATQARTYYSWLQRLGHIISCARIFAGARYSQQMRASSGTDGVVRHEMPRGITAIGVFLFFGVTMASLAGGDIELAEHIPR